MLIDLINGRLVLENRQAGWEELAHYADWLQYSLWQWADVFAPELSKDYPRPPLQKVVAVTRDGKVYCGTTDGKFADDMCEACGKNVANRECAHGLLCDVCDAQVHGSVGGKCEVVNR